MGEKQSGSALDDRLAELNNTLEKCSVRVKSGRFYLRSRHFPPRPGETESGRGEIKLGVSATIAGFKIAAAKAKEIDSQLLWGKFSWAEYKKKSGDSIGDWIKRFELDHWEHTADNPTKRRSFLNTYQIRLEKLPQDEPISIAVLRNAIVKMSKPATRSREMWCIAIGKFAKFATKGGAIDPGELLEFQEELKILKAGYEPAPILPEDLPTDAQIVEIWRSIKNPAWQWVYGMLATYGLRPHEIWYLDLDRFTAQTDALRVLNETKTGARIVYPCLPQWREEFQLWNAVLPKTNIAGKSNEEIGKKVAFQFRQIEIWHIPYALRHAWCIRLALEGVQDSIASRWAGHSISLHAATYHRAISEAQQQKVFDRMKNRKEL